MIDPMRTYTPEEAERIFEAMDAYFVRTALECLVISLVIAVAFFAAVIGIARAKEWWDSYRDKRRCRRKFVWKHLTDEAKDLGIEVNNG